MQSPQPSPIARDHTLLGVCEALGEDFGFNPLYLRVALAGTLYWNPIAAVAAYLAAGLVVAFSRWLAPEPSAAKGRPAATPTPIPAEASEDREPLPLAA